jgi:large subunit ribosomal protein L7e
MAFEEEFGSEISDSEAEKILTVGDAVKFIEGKARKANMEQAKKDRVAARKVALANAEKYFKEYQAADAKLIKDKRDAKAAGNFFVEGEAKVALVVRIRGINKLAPKPKKILQLLRLRQLHNAVFVKLNKATWNMLRMVEPFVTYGFPSRATI